MRHDFVSPPGYEHLDDDDWTDRHGCAWGEANGEAGPELYCAVGANKGGGIGPNQLLTFTPDGVKDRAKRFGVRDSYGRGRSANWLDHDSDGDLDLFVTNFDRAGRPNVLFENRRGDFQRTRAGVGDVLRSYSSSWSDWDSDGDPDLLVMQFRAGTVAYENRGGRFSRVSLPGITGVDWRSAAWGDFDGDKRTDVHMVGENRAAVFRNTPSGFRMVDDRRIGEGRMSAWLDFENDGDLDLFVVRGARGIYQSGDELNLADFILLRKKGRFIRYRREAFRGPKRGNGDSVAVADSDRDGKTDLYVTNGHFEYATWVGRNTYFSNLTEGGGSVGLTLRGPRWNPWGIGARVRVRTSAKTYWREVTDGVTFRAQSEVGHLTMGLGSASSARIRIVWPGGKRDCLRADAGSSHEVSRGSQPC